MPEPPATNSSRLRLAATIARFITVLILLGMFIGTHIPPSVPFPSISNFDKVMHAGAYMLLAFSALASWELSIGELRPQHYFTVWLCGTLYGAIDEVTQVAVGRTCDGLDWVADITGIVIGLTLFRIARPLMYRFL